MLIFLCQGKFYCFQEIWSAYRINNNKNGQNATTQVYRKRRSHVKDDFYLLSAMEEYAQKEFGISVRFAKKKQALFLDMLILTMLKHLGITGYNWGKFTLYARPLEIMGANSMADNKKNYLLFKISLEKGYEALRYLHIIPPSRRMMDTYIKMLRKHFKEETLFLFY